MGTDALDQGDILLDLQDAIEWMYGEYGGVTIGRINRLKVLLGQLERTIE